MAKLRALSDIDIDAGVTTLRDCCVLDGQIEMRAKLVREVLSWGPIADLDLVCRYTQRHFSLERVPSRVEELLRDRAKFDDVLASAKLWARRSDPGSTDRAENMAHERDQTVRAGDRVRMGACAYSMVMHEWKSPDAAARAMVKHFPHETYETLLPQMRDLLEAGARTRGHCCPQLAAHMLMQNDSRRLVLWNTLHGFRVLAARDARKTMELPTETEARELVEAVRLDGFAFTKFTAARNKANTAEALAVEAIRTENAYALDIEPRSLRPVRISQ